MMLWSHTGTNMLQKDDTCHSLNHMYVLLEKCIDGSYMTVYLRKESGHSEGGMCQ